MVAGPCGRARAGVRARRGAAGARGEPRRRGPFLVEHGDRLAQLRHRSILLEERLLRRQPRRRLRLRLPPLRPDEPGRLLEARRQLLAPRIEPAARDRPASAGSPPRGWLARGRRRAPLHESL